MKTIKQKKTSPYSDVVKAAVSIVLCQAVGGLGGLVTYPAISTWYAVLNKPSFNPPNWIFGPMWTLLYLLMGVSLFLVWRKGPARHKTFLAVFGLQLCLNFLWSLIFFGWHLPGLAFADIVFLWALILWSTLLAGRISSLAGYLMIPYLVWVSFAGVLNYFLWILNL